MNNIIHANYVHLKVYVQFQNSAVDFSVSFHILSHLPISDMLFVPPVVLVRASVVFYVCICIAHKQMNSLAK